MARPDTVVTRHRGGALPPTSDLANMVVLLRNGLRLLGNGDATGLNYQKSPIFDESKEHVRYLYPWAGT